MDLIRDNPGLTGEAKDLLQNLLQEDPTKRLDASQALNHAFFAKPALEQMSFFQLQSAHQSALRELVIAEVLLEKWPTVEPLQQDVKKFQKQVEELQGLMVRRIQADETIKELTLYEQALHELSAFLVLIDEDPDEAELRITNWAEDISVFNSALRKEIKALLSTDSFQSISEEMQEVLQNAITDLEDTIAGYEDRLNGR